MWQSQVEIKHYFVAYLITLTAFEVLKTIPLGVGLIRTVLMYQVVMSLHSMYESRP